MATYTPKVKTSRAVGAGAATTIGSYTVAANTKSTIIGLTLANITSDAIAGSAGVHDGTNFTYLVKGATIPAGGSLIVVGGDQKIVLEPSHSIRANSSVASSIDAVMSILEAT
jgi:hypothetical protein